MAFLVEEPPLKLYVNTDLASHATLGYSPLLFPFEQFSSARGLKKRKKKHVFQQALWEKYQFDATYYRIVSEAEKADAVFLPYNYWELHREYPDILNAFLQDTASIGKPIVIDAIADTDARIPIRNAFILRPAQYRFKKEPNEIIIPAFVEDLREAYAIDDAIIQPRQKTSYPSVGFVGWARMPLKDYLRFYPKRVLLNLFSCWKKRYPYFLPGIYFRQKALRVLQQTAGISTNFILRETYSGNARNIRGRVEEVRREFVTNILTSDYTLSVKGVGNYSQRFYETLSAGRIPLFIDTESVLPLESLINYRECCVFVDCYDLNRLGEILVEFHQRVSPEQFLWMQQRAREIFATYLRVDVFTKYMMQELRNCFTAKN